jgi:hypothetical protein
MGIKFYGGPFDGKEIEQSTLNQYAIALPLNGDLGHREFVLMPPPETWDKLLQGEKVQTNPVYPYERIYTSDGLRFEWLPFGEFDQAVLQSKLKVQPSARTILSTFTTDLRRSIIAAITDLLKITPEEWTNRRAVRIADDESDYLVQLPNAMKAFVRILGSGELELLDIMSEGTLRLFLQKFGKVSVAG